MTLEFSKRHEKTAIKKVYSDPGDVSVMELGLNKCKAVNSISGTRKKKKKK